MDISYEDEHLFTNVPKDMSKNIQTKATDKETIDSSPGYSTEWVIVPREWHGELCIGALGSVNSGLEVLEELATSKLLPKELPSSEVSGSLYDPVGEWITRFPTPISYPLY